MGVRRATLAFAAVSMVTLAGLGVWGVASDGRALRWLLPLAVMGGLWGWVEWVSRSSDATRVRHVDLLPWHRTFFGMWALFLAARYGARLAFAAEVIDPEWIPVARRSFGVAGGLMFAVWGNYLPKLLSPWQRSDQPFDWQGVHRFVGRLFTLAGLTVMIAWLFLPLVVARWVSAGVVLASCLAAVARKLHSLATWPVQRDRALPGR